MCFVAVPLVCVCAERCLKWHYCRQIAVDPGAPFTFYQPLFVHRCVEYFHREA